MLVETKLRSKSFALDNLVLTQTIERINKSNWILCDANLTQNIMDHPVRCGNIFLSLSLRQRVEKRDLL